MMAKMLRAGMKDVLNQNYIIMCRAKGMTNKEVVLRHALKNAILPLLSISGPLIAQ
ncbi:oligopeptide transport system permease protein OppB [Acetivibrio straminisolvens JCM 21531]|uniref:Oligopeptide transport system permease protein OppB n=1 Tax=Acetivibrio straminisolvens JCM 21531 TaxID=1294263 RepID=W4V9P9_9FIRM|nr:oligopeptide transport system permease protein OppB [Acetivibrio straminisolvens JCM 21531]